MGTSPWAKGSRSAVRIPGNKEIRPARCGMEFEVDEWCSEAWGDTVRNCLSSRKPCHWIGGILCSRNWISGILLGTTSTVFMTAGTIAVLPLARFDRKQGGGALLGRKHDLFWRSYFPDCEYHRPGQGGPDNDCDFLFYPAFTVKVR